MAKRLLRLCAVALATVRGIKVGDTLPEADLDYALNEQISTTKLCKGRKIVLVGLPGAFTPTWSTQQIPGYMAKQADLIAAGIDEVVIFAVNDGAVMSAWGKDQGVSGIVKLYGDTRMELTKALGTVLDHPGPMKALGNNRCQRMSMFVDDCKVKTFNLAADPGDPAGDDNPTVTLAEKMVDDLKKKDEL